MSEQLTLTVNGETRRTATRTIADLVRELDLLPEKVAVEHNGEIAPRSRLAEIALSDGDMLEIVHFVGGG
ncbi:sulfur carrier protein ThiS [Parerythrobacter aestuarii]|uniref:sulfur carrier protein ThiS n=1 Tax=Parerythrobacter aestuarii TaxID=3020909 RepID=UPI0024DE8A9F|nr:sulfur carrier protein ThiS [Parerythrobacter aestuarii]